jgi:protein gp37
MARDSKIEWTHHTFNPWWGCVKVSPACAHCYAESFAHRLGASLWGRSAPRRFFGADYWRQPLRWDEHARLAGERRRVFCASMADLFEARSDLHRWREQLWPLIESTPNLDWLLLTKRPQNIHRMAPWRDSWPPNVWLGTTAENQKHADLRIPRLLELPARVRFISAEPLLGPLTLRQWAGIDWVIAGGESGHGARPTDPAWVRSLRDESKDAGVAFHFKQWGHWAPSIPAGARARQQLRLGPVPDHALTLYGLGKAAAGRLLDGRTWDEFPQVIAAIR